MGAVMDPEIIEAQEFRTPPYSDRLERAVLGCVLLDNAQLHEIKRYIKTADVFYRPASRKVWRAMLELHGNGKPIEDLTLLEHLEDTAVGDRNALDAIGGPSYVLTLTREPAAASSAPVYAEQLAEFHRRRVLIREVEKSLDRLYSGESAEDSVRRIQGGITQAMSSNTRDESTNGITDRWLRYREDRLKGRVGALYCGVEPVDLLMQWEPGELHYIGAYTGHGKTTVLAAVLANMMNLYDQAPPEAAAGEEQLPDRRVVVSIHQSEVAEVKLAARLVTAYKGGAIKEHHIIRPEQIPDHERSLVERRIMQGFGWLEDRDCWPREARQLTLEEIKTETYRLRALYPHRPLVVAIDYIQQVMAPGFSGNYERIAHVSLELANLASDTKAIIICATQLTARSGEVMPLAMPQPNQAKECRRIEDDAARFLIWHRPYPKGQYPDFGILELAKDRYGHPGYVACRSDLSTNTFRPYDGVPPEVPGLYTQEVFSER